MTDEPVRPDTGPDPLEQSGDEQSPPPKAEAEPESDTLPFVTLVPNMVTTLGLCAGLTAIRFVMVGKFELAVGLILVAVVIDALDGLLARRLKATSDFGAQLDSLSDFLNFGVAPGLLVYRMAQTQDEQAGGWMFILIYSVCCCMRLARFNVAQRLAADIGETKPANHFTGVPAPAGAMLALLPVFVAFDSGADLTAFPVPVEFYLGIVGLLMISRLPTFSLKSVRVPRGKAIWVLVLLVLIVGLLLTAFWRSLIVMLLIYVASLLHSAVRVVLRRRS